MASYVYDLQPEDLETGLRRLDAMMASWNAKGVRLGYPGTSQPAAASLNTDTNVPDAANESVITNLAVRLAPGYGKVPSADTKMIAKNTFDVLMQRSVFPAPWQLPSTMPLGAGNKPLNIDQVYVRPPLDPVLAGPDGPIEFD